MVFSIIKTSLFSLIFIALIHYLFIFFKNMLTVPKIKDLVNSPTERYNEILNTIQKSSSITQNSINNENNINQNSINQNSINENNNKINHDDNMNLELGNFLQDLKTSNTENNNDVMGSTNVMGPYK